MQDDVMVTYGVARSAWLALATSCIVCGMFFFVFAYNLDSLTSDTPVAIKLAIYIVAVLVLLSGLKLLTQSETILLKANKEGIFFPHPSMKNSDFLLVPWSNVGSIELGSARTGEGVGQAVKIEIHAAANKVAIYFPESNVGKGSDNVWFTAGLTSAFINKAKCINELNEIKNLSLK